MKYYLDDTGDVWKVNHTTKEYWLVEANLEDKDFVPLMGGWFDDYIIIHDMIEITEEKAKEIIERNNFLYAI